VTELSRHGDAETRVFAVRGLGVVAERVRDSFTRQALTRTFFTPVLHAALNDYQTDERGDVGSLVRLEGLKSLHFSSRSSEEDEERAMLPCYWSVHRLALERLDKVRIQAGQMLALGGVAGDMSSGEYFASAGSMVLSGNGTKLPFSDTKAERYAAFLEGFASSVSAGTETTVLAARTALYEVLYRLPVTCVDGACLLGVGVALCQAIEDHFNEERVLGPLIDLTSYLLDVRLLQGLAGSEFPWRRLLSNVQKAHFKSSSIPKLVAATHIYRSLCGVDVVEKAAQKRLLGMLLNPMAKVCWSPTPLGCSGRSKRGLDSTCKHISMRNANLEQQVRLAAAEAVWMSRRSCAEHDGFWQLDWALPVKEHKAFVQYLVEREEES